MHPSIRILSLLIFAALAPWLPPVLLWPVVFALLLYGALQRVAGTAIVRGLRRIRWLLLSLLVLYAWFTPGAPLAPALGPLSPSDTGLALAFARAGVLVAMVAMAIVMLAPVPPAELAAALQRLLAWPVHTAAGDRCAARIGLLLAELPRIERRVRDSLGDRESSFAARAAHLVASVEADAATAANIVPMAMLPRVPRVQWLYPLLLLAGGIASMLSGF